MTGETNLSILLREMKPQLNDGEYVFCAVDRIDQFPTAEIICFFRETEAITIIVRKDFADQNNLAYTVICSWISLTIHSSLEAVGLTAAFSKALSDAGISCNTVAAYYHDHIFVPANQAQQAMNELLKLTR